MGDFALSFRRIQAEERQGTLWILGGAILVLTAWMCWATMARLSLYEESTDARIELDGATYPVAAPFVGRIVVTNLHVGQEVRRGDILVELDSMPQQLQLEEEQVRMAGLESPLMKLQAQIDAEEKLRGDEALGAQSSFREADSRVREAKIPAQFAAQELARMQSLYSQRVVSARDLEKAQSEAEHAKGEVTTLQAAASRVPQDHTARDRERELHIVRLQGEIAEMEAQRNTLRADVARLGYEIERRRIRAPADGKIGEAVTLQVGAVVSEGARLASIVPTGRLLVVAHYPARAALGRIRSGQPATLRLSGFPWAEFGTVSATVTHVAQEVRDGKVRVELALSHSSSFRGSLAHGMPGTLEVAVERVSPLGLTMRTAGQWMTRPL